MNFLEDSLVLALGRAIKAEEKAEATFDKLRASSDARRRNAAEDRFLAARKRRMAAEAELAELQSRPLRETARALEQRNEMRELLERHGYDRRDAERLQGEGMGPWELAERLRNAPGSVGSLEYTHSLKKV